MKRFAISVTFLCVLAASSAFAGDPIPMNLLSDQTARIAPNEQSPVCVNLAEGSSIQARFVAEGWVGFASPETKGKTCWVRYDQVRQTKTRSAVLAVPLLVDAGRAVIGFLADLFTGRLFQKDQATLKIDPGTMVSVLEEAGEKVRIRTDAGQEGWIAKQALTKLKAYTVTPLGDQGVWEGHEPVSSSSGLLLDIWVQKADGTRIPDGGVR